MHDIGDALVRNAFAEPVMDMEMLTMTYKDVPSLMRDLKSIGAHNVTQGRSRKLTGKGRLQQVVDAYEQFRNDGLIPASYEVVYGHAWITEAAPSHTVQVAFNGSK
jgi:malonyl-CoA O-methyltransferase